MERISVKEVKVIPSGVSKTSGKRYPEFRVVVLSSGEDVGIDKNLPITIEGGKVYDVELKTNPNGKRAIVSACVVKGVVADTQKAGATGGAVEDKMTKAEWRAKDEGIKWQACFKASCHFHAARPNSSILDVIADATSLYFAKPTQDAVPDDVPEGDVFDENGI